MIILVFICYFYDVKKYGKENLAIGLFERLINYFICIPLPIIFGLLSRW